MKISSPLSKICKMILVFGLFCLAHPTPQVSALTINAIAGDASSIQSSINTAHEGDVINLPDGTYVLRSTLIFDGKRNITLTGGKGAIIQLPNRAGWGKDPTCADTYCAAPLIRGIGASGITFSGFTMDGNCRGQGSMTCHGTANHPRGCEFYKLFAFNRSTNLTISNMVWRDGCADGLTLRNSSGLKYFGNQVYCIGHEATYNLYSSGFDIHDNYVETCTDTAFRFDASSNGKIYNNKVTSSKQDSSTGPGMYVDHNGSNFEFYNNEFVNINATGLMLNATINGCSGINIHNNSFTNVGHRTRNSYTQSGILTENCAATISSNYFDNAGESVFRAGEREGVPTGPTTIQVSNNTILNYKTLVFKEPRFANHNFVMNNNCLGYAGGSCPASAVAARNGVSLGDFSTGGGGLPGGGGSTPPPSADEICATYNQETKKWENVGDENHNGYADCADPACKCIVPPPIVAPWLGSPIAVIDEGAQRITGSGKTITLHGGNSRDTDGGNITSYLWSAEGGTPTSGNAANFEVSFSTAGTHKVVLQVTDNDGMVSKAEISVVVKDCQGNICDKDNDTYLSPAYGGNDCDDEHSTVHPGTKCLSQCAGDNIIQGDCSDEGKCINEVQIASCIGMGDPCKMDVCQPQPDGNVHCAADVTRDLCHGGILPCGKLLNNPDTPFDETLPCNFCAMLLLAQLIIEWMVRMSAFFAVFMITVAGIMYIFGLGSPDQINQARATIKYALIGFAVVLIAWSIINSLLLTAGYINPLGGDWYTACN